MKPIVNVISVALLSLFLSHQGKALATDQEMVIETQIDHVTVYQNGAHISRSSKISLPQGETTLKVRGLSPYLNEESVQVKGKGNFTILSVSSEKDFLESLEENDKLKLLREQLTATTEKIDDEDMMLGLLKEKESFLAANKVIGGKDQSLDAGNFKALYDMYTSNMQQIREGILAKTRSLTKLREKQKNIQDQINQIRSGRELPSEMISIVVKSASATQGILDINYMVNNAGWYPSYDIRVDSPDKPANLVYKANVYQKTGVEWKNIMLSFSNATPDRSGNIPVLFPWYINFLPENMGNVRPYADMAKKSTPGLQKPEAAAASREMDNDLSLMEVPTVGTVKSERTTSIEFDIDVAYTITSTGKPRSIDMMRTTLPAYFEYESIPRVENAAFLVAKIHDWEQFDLMTGEASIYFENTYVGKSLLDVGNIRDTMDISLGRDQGIVIKREKRKDYTSDQFIGGNRIETYTWEISVRNTKKVPINIRIKDQIPISSNKDITVEANDLSNGKLDPKTGIIVWQLPLKAGESRSLTMGYTVKYPKERKVGL